MYVFSTDMGEILVNYYGKWQSGCFPRITPSSFLDELCQDLGYNGTKGREIFTIFTDSERQSTRPFLQGFQFLNLTDKPIIRFNVNDSLHIVDIQDPDCYRLIAECVY